MKLMYGSKGLEAFSNQELLDELCERGNFRQEQIPTGVHIQGVLTDCTYEKPKPKGEWGNLDYGIYWHFHAMANGVA